MTFLCGHTEENYWQEAKPTSNTGPMLYELSIFSNSVLLNIAPSEIPDTLRTASFCGPEQKSRKYCFGEY